mgnify:CR=1 FL=1
MFGRSETDRQHSQPVTAVPNKELRITATATAARLLRHVVRVVRGLSFLRLLPWRVLQTDATAGTPEGVRCTISHDAS